jgi:protein disulfide-isomerase A1
MKSFLLSFVALLACAYASNVELDEGVMVLTDDNFNQVIEENPFILVEFYAPWCGHCKKLAPEYSQAAKTLAKLDPPIPIAKLDATAHEKAAEKFGIKGFPTLKLFKSGSPSDYEGGRTAGDIVSWLKKKSGPSVKTLTEGDIESFKSEGKVVVVGHFTSDSDAEYKQYAATADSFDDVPFGAVLGGASNSVKVYKDFDEKEATFSGKVEKSALSSFVSEHRLPLVIPFNQDTARLLFGEEQPVRVQLLLMTKGDDTESLSVFGENAKKFKGKVLFVHVDETQERVMSYFGVKESDLPTSVLVQMPKDGGMKKFFPPTKSAKDHEAFINDFFAGKLKPSLKSDDVPNTQDEDVYVLVGKEFEKVALDDDKDVLVEFYAPWCGHCKALAPKYDALAESLKDIKSVVVAKMDSTANEIDHPDINISGFPTLKFFPAKSGGKVLDYEGKRETQDLLDFIHKNAGIKFTKPAVESESDEEEEEGHDEL